MQVFYINPELIKVSGLEFDAWAWEAIKLSDLITGYPR